VKVQHGIIAAYLVCVPRLFVDSPLQYAIGRGLNSWSITGVKQSKLAKLKPKYWLGLLADKAEKSTKGAAYALTVVHIACMLFPFSQLKQATAFFGATKLKYYGCILVGTIFQVSMFLVVGHWLKGALS
jgi:hypothetical protein